MIYKVFRAKEEEKINEFLELYKSQIGEKGYWSDPKTGDIVFLFNERFEPEVVGDAHMRSVWLARHKEACTKLAELQVNLMELERKDPKSVVPTGEMIKLAGHEVEKSKEVSDVIKNHVEGCAYWNNLKLDLEKLLDGDTPKSLVNAFEK